MLILIKGEIVKNSDLKNLVKKFFVITAIITSVGVVPNRGVWASGQTKTEKKNEDILNTSRSRNRERSRSGSRANSVIGEDEFNRSRNNNVSFSSQNQRIVERNQNPNELDNTEENVNSLVEEEINNNENDNINANLNDRRFRIPNTPSSPMTLTEASLQDIPVLQQRVLELESEVSRLHENNSSLVLETEELQNTNETLRAQNARLLEENRRLKTANTQNHQIGPNQQQILTLRQVNQNQLTANREEENNAVNQELEILRRENENLRKNTSGTASGVVIGALATAAIWGITKFMRRK